MVMATKLKKCSHCGVDEEQEPLRYFEPDSIYLCVFYCWELYNDPKEIGIY